MQTPDFGLTAQDYARHRAGFPPSTFERLATYGVGLPGQDIVDLATGTGALGRGFARRGCHVTGVDISAQMMVQARALDAAEGLTSTYTVARAEDTGLPAASADVVGAGQAWHWFDRPKAASEVGRVLKPGGVALIAHFDWLPLPGNLVEAVEALIVKHNPKWDMGGGDGFHTPYVRDLEIAGFSRIETFSYDVDVPYTQEAWRGRIRASAGIGASLPPAGVEAFDREHAALLRERFPEDPLTAEHRVFCILGWRA